LKAARQTQATGSSAVNTVHAAETDSDTTARSNEEKKEIKGVFVIREGKAQFVEIATGIADQKQIEVITGLQVGDSVISGPYRVLRTIKDGDFVKITHEGGDGKESKS
jgi:HlyD family secretion protein